MPASAGGPQNDGNASRFRRRGRAPIEDSITAAPMRGRGGHGAGRRGGRTRFGCAWKGRSRRQPPNPRDIRDHQSEFGEPDEPVGVTVLGNELILTGPDSQTLDELEELITALVDGTPARPRWTVFYLKTADATETAQMIERLFPQSSVSSPAPTNDFFGGFGGGLSLIRFRHAERDGTRPDAGDHRICGSSPTSGRMLCL